jgi:hypothetical protein
MSYTLRDVGILCDLAKEAGAQVETWDYGFSAGFRFAGDDKAILIAQVYRPERDGYTGGKIITEDLLKELLESGKAGLLTDEG